VDVTARVFALTGPLHDRYADRSYLFVRALDLAGVRTRLVALGPLELPDPDLDHPFRHWSRVASLLTTAMSPHFVNVVIAPIGWLMGTPKLETREGGDGVQVYDPSTAFRALYTAEVHNVAVVSWTDASEADADVTFLASHYSEVYGASERDRVILRNKGVPDCQWCPPADFAARMRELTRVEGQT
jgi:hypothetical protein